MSEQRPFRILVTVSRPLAHVVPIEHGGEQFEAVSPVSLPAVHLVRDELRRVLAADDIPVAVRFLAHATLAEVQRALPEGYAVVHFAGHGAEDGRLLLENEDGTADPVPPQVLAEALQEYGVRLALISACFSGQAGRALHQAGIPDVVMVDEKWPMAAGAAALFNGQFYACLARGMRPSEAYKAGVRAVRTDARFGDRAEPPRNEETGEIEPRYGERFDCLWGDDRPLVDGLPAGGYQELRPLQAPCNVPANPVFVGREAECIHLIRLMQNAQVVTLTGPGGIGKTAVARQVARWQHERGHFLDGTLEVRAYEKRTAAGLASAFAVALRDALPEFRLDPERPWGSVRNALSGRWLILLDNAEDLTAEATRTLDQELLGQLPDLRLLATSHHPLGVVGREESVEIETMMAGWQPGVPGPAEMMFLAYVPGRRRGEVLEHHFDAVRDICRAVDGYPLGIVLTAAQLEDEKETPEHILERVRAAMPEALACARAANMPERHRSVGAALKSSLDRLTGPARQLLAHMAVCPGGASEAMLTALEEASWEALAAGLRHGRLVRWHDGRHTMLPPIRAVALTILPADELDAYRRRAAEWLTGYAQQFADSTEPLNRALLTLERENLLEAVGWAERLGWDDLLIALVDALEQWLGLEGELTWLAEAQGRAVEAARRAGSPLLLGQRLYALGRTCYYLADFDRALSLYDQAQGALAQCPPGG